MTTRENIIDKADQFIRNKGYNAFSFKDISNDIGIKTASIHYHFPTKSDLGVATIKEHIARYEVLKKKVANESPLIKLESFLAVHTQIKHENKVCIVGSLATDLNTLDESIKDELKIFAKLVIDWLTEVLTEGKEQNIFDFQTSARTKALMIITNMVAIVQLSRLTNDDDFELVRETILTELRPKKIMKRVVVTGLGAVTPIGNNVQEYWNSLINGVSGAAPITRFDTTQFKTKFACEVKNFDASPIFEKNEIRKYDLFTQYALHAADEAVKNANIDFDTLNKNRIGVIWGCGDGGISTFEEQFGEYKLGNGTPRFSPFFIPKRIVNIASGVISIKYGLRGINYTTAAACSASNTAIIDAFNYIRWGKADMIISGGSEASVSESSIGGFNASKALSTLNEDHSKASRPFDVTRDGFVLGEGAGVVILESYEHAVKRNAVILAEIVGGGLAADAYHLTGTHPEGEGAVLGMELALEEAGITPDKIDYINAHATSTPAGDLSELKAIEKVFGINPNANISATKSMTGHLLGGAGAIEAVACIKALQENIVPPTINTQTIEQDYAEKFNLTLGKAQAREVNYAMSNTFGFGGHVASSIFKKFKE